MVFTPNSFILGQNLRLCRDDSVVPRTPPYTLSIFSMFNFNICANVLIENEVKIGNNVTIKSGVQVWDSVEIEDNVFVGPNVTFTNDCYPKSGKHDYILQKTKICNGASIGANSTILPGVTIGKNSLIGAGSVVTKDIPAGELWLGNPAKFIRKI